MIKLLTSKIRYKIMGFMFVLMTITSFVSMYIIYSNVSSSSIRVTEKNLKMLNSAIFQSLRNSMITGDPTVIKKAEHDASLIPGVVHLKVEKSQKLIDLYASEQKVSIEEDIINVFDSKKEKLIDGTTNGIHSLRIIKPMIAQADCMACHANQEIGDVIGVIDLTFSLEESDNDLYNLIKNNVIATTILSWLTIIIIFFLVKYISKPIEELKKSIQVLIKFSSADQDIEIASNDEIGEVAKAFNLYLKKIRATMKEDQQVVQEAEEVIKMAKIGFFSYKIESSSSNRTTNDLKESINDMIDSLDYKLSLINKALSEFGMGNFDYKLQLENSSGTIASIALSTDALGNNSSELLATILFSANSLDNSIKILSDASSQLSQSANEQSGSLEEVTNEISNISKSIQSNLSNVTTMSTLSDEVNLSASNGKKLANETALSMDEINTQVSSINDSITIIEQIAFQTNILSLNAAVEAATAGEAGKGFAVVAQEVRNLASRSAAAANEIKALVENASEKAKKGKIISDNMISGYGELTSKITHTKEMIDKVSVSSIEQSNGITEITNSINIIDNNTKNSAENARNIDTLSNEVQELSTSLMSISNHVTYRENAKKQICDIDMTYYLNKLQLGHITFKDANFVSLDKKETKKVTDDKSCALGKWIIESEKNNELFTTTENWKLLKENHYEVHSGVQNFLNINSTGAHSNELIPQSEKVEKAIRNVFQSLNQVKVENCKNKDTHE